MVLLVVGAALTVAVFGWAARVDVGDRWLKALWLASGLAVLLLGGQLGFRFTKGGQGRAKMFHWSNNALRTVAFGIPVIVAAGVMTSSGKPWTSCLLYLAFLELAGVCLGAFIGLAPRTAS